MLLLKMIAGHADISMSLYGIAIMAIVDITGSILVLIFWQGNDTTVRGLTQTVRELQYSYIIGALMMLLGIFLILDRYSTSYPAPFFIYILISNFSVSNLIEGKSPSNSKEAGSSISIFGTTAGFLLALYKYNIGKELESPVIMAGNVQIQIFKNNK